MRMKQMWGFISLGLGAISLTALVVGWMSDFEPQTWVVVVIALAGLLSGLNALAKRGNRFVAWTGVVFSSLALVATSIAFGIGHGLR